MKIFAYLFIMLTCVINWFVSAYRPISQYLSKKVFLKSNFITSVMAFIPQHHPYQSSSTEGGSTSWDLYRFSSQSVTNLESLVTGSFSKVFGSSDAQTKRDRAYNHHKNSSSKYQPNNHVSSISLSTIASEMIHSDTSSTHSLNSHDHITSKSNIIGFMDYDPKAAAIISHRSSSSLSSSSVTKRKQANHNSHNSWFHN